MLTWEMVAMVAMLILMTGLIVALVCVIMDTRKADTMAFLVDQIADKLADRYVPAVKDMTVETTIEIVDRLTDKIPDMMKKTMKSFKELEEDD